MKVQNAAIEDEFVVVKSHNTITEVAKTIATAGIPDVVVLDETDKVIGCIDDYDIVSKVMAEEKDPKEVKAKDIMYVAPPVTLDTDLSTVSEMMKELDITMVPVVDSESKLLGVVTLMDVLEGLAFEEFTSRGFFAKLKDIFR